MSSLTFMRSGLLPSHDTHWKMLLEKTYSACQPSWKNLFDIVYPDQEKPVANVNTNGVTQDYQYWHDVVGNDLKILLEGALYDEASTAQTLQLFFDIVAPHLGPAPKAGMLPNWRSFMTDDFSPLEYSWAWEVDSPKVRYSFEPIDHHAGSVSDPYNRVASLKCIDRLQHRFSATDWSRFNALDSAFYEKSRAGPQIDLPVELRSKNASPTSIMLAFDVEKAGLPPLVKAYLILAKAEQYTTRSRLLFESLAKIHANTSLPALSVLEDYLRANETINPYEIIIAAVDCVASTSAKVKIYARSQRTSFSSVISTLTLGGQNNELWTQDLIDQLRELWHCIFAPKSCVGQPQGKDDHNDQVELQGSPHETAGILYYFDINQTNTTPSVKVYLPVKHYGLSDEAVALGLLRFLQRSKHHQAQQKHAQAFYRTLHELNAHKDMTKSLGCQTYLSCAIKNNQLYLTSYLSPELYRWPRAV